MRFRVAILRFAFLGIIPLAAAITPWSASSAAAAGNSLQLCPGSTGTITIPTPPRGMAAVVDTYVLNDCTIQVSQAHVVPATQMQAAAGASSSGATFRSISGGATQSVSSNGAQAVQRLWDAANLLLNEYGMHETWTYDGTYVLSANAWNTAQYKSEPPPSRGWYVDAQWLGWIDGCFGCSWLQLEGTMNFGYQGIFDPSGSKYYNTYLSFFTVTGAGTYYGCSLTHTWRNSVAGWHMQQWCQYGA